MFRREDCFDAIGPAMVQCELKKGDWVVHKKGGWYHAGDGEFFTQLGRVVSSWSLDANGKDRIVIETALSVEPLHYLVTPTDELEKVQLFDEPRRRGVPGSHPDIPLGGREN